MKTQIKLEELAMFIVGYYLFTLLPFSWWWFFVFLLAPDIGMLGYIFGNKAGAISYNILHHKGLAIVIYLLGAYFSIPFCEGIGIILFSHSSLDRALGYGLKYEKGFKYTHLGELGENNG
ncbi:MAG: DUF4260 domain-containing protein [Flavobacteriaceae bacterium]|nr:MAG: DUF4260 domain-containing protein [Flavobacteriaceae bacterium]